MNKQYALCFLFFFAVSAAEAALGLQLNTDTKEFALVGSDTGTPGTLLNGGGYIVWQFKDTFAFGASYGDNVTFTSTNSSPRFGADTTLTSDFDGIEFVSLALYLTSPDLTTIDGTGVFLSYADFDPRMAETLEAAIGHEIPLGTGTGFSALVVSAVPEPATYALLIGATTLGIAWLQRRQRKLRYLRNCHDRR